jgi:hypothetical protein
MLILSWSFTKHGHHRQFLFLIDWFLKNLLLWNRVAKWTKIWLEASVKGSVESFLRTEWKVNDTDSTHWASSLLLHSSTPLIVPLLQKTKFYIHWDSIIHVLLNWPLREDTPLIRPSFYCRNGDLIRYTVHHSAFTELSFLDDRLRNNIQNAFSKHV